MGTAFIVIGLNTDEFNRGDERPVKRFANKADLMNYITHYNGDVSRLEIYEVRRMEIRVSLE